MTFIESLGTVLKDDKEDYARELEAETFDLAYLERLVTELVSSNRWGRGFYPIV